MMKTKTALITGITGQDGSFLAELLLDKGYEVYGFIRRLSRPNLENIENIKDSINLIDGDLADQASIMNAVEKSSPDEIYNLGAQSFVATSWQQAEYTCNVTGLGAFRVFEAARMARKIKEDIKIYQASSSEMFGDSPPPQNELTQLNPRSPYGAAKAFAHNMAKVYRDSYDMFISCGILFNHECVTAETPVFIRRNGIIDIFPIEDIVPHRTEYNGMKHTTEVNSKNMFEVWDRGEWSRATCMTATWNGFDKSGRSYNKNKPVYRIVARGAFLQTTGDHIIYVMNKNMDITTSWDDKEEKNTKVIIGKPAWKIDLQRKPGDCLALIELPEPTNIITMTEEEAWLIGALVSDGYIGRSESKKYNSERIMGRFSNKDIRLIEIVEELWHKLTGECTTRTMGESGFVFDRKEKDIHIVNLLGESNYLRYLHDEIYTRSGYKRIPKRILNASKDIRLAFLRGYNAGDGTKAVSDFEFQAATTNSAVLAAGLFWLIENTLDHQRPTIYDVINNGELYYKILIGAPEGRGEHMQEPLEEIIRTGLIDYKGWVYDLATETGTFHAGIGHGWIHNSERRGIEFVSMKIANAVARIDAGLQDKLKLGNLDAKRDWGYTKDYVEAMWMMMQQDKPDNFVIASGENHTIREFAKIAFDRVGLNWQDYVVIDPLFFRPAEIYDLRGDYNKAKKILKWEPKTSFKDLVRIMVDSEIHKLQK